MAANFKIKNLIPLNHKVLVIAKIWKTIRCNQFSSYLEPKKFELYLCFVIGGDNSKLVTIKINEAVVNDSEAMVRFFSAVKFGVNKMFMAKYNR